MARFQEERQAEQKALQQNLAWQGHGYGAPRFDEKGHVWQLIAQKPHFISFTLPATRPLWVRPDRGAPQ